jgi:hypothetical protein
MAGEMPDDDPLSRQHDRLTAEQQELLREHRLLEQHPADIPGHLSHSKKLREHIAALHAHLAALRARDLRR